MVYLPPPTPLEVNHIVHYVYDDMAGAMNEKVIVGVSKRTGKHSRYVFTRIGDLRFRVSITTIPDMNGDNETDYSISAKEV